MITPPKPLNEQERLEALLSLKVLDTPPEESYDRHVQKLAQILDVPIAYIALIDANRQWLKSVVGPLECEMDRDQSFCGHTILEHQPLIVPDTREDPRFAGNPLVTGEPHLRFYAGVPLSSADGFNVGTLCIADQQPRDLSAEDLEVLQAFAAIIEEKINRTPKVFISYSHKDEAWKDRLVSHLAVLKKQDLLDFWDDRQIDTGGGWRDEIQEAIESANVAILLISADFLSSNFILGDEVPRLLERRDKEGLHIMPVIIKSCPWQQVLWLEQMNMYPKDANPLACVEDHEIDLCLTEFASKVLEKARDTHQRFEPSSWPVAVATEADAAPIGHEAPRPVPPAEQPVAVAARTDAAPIAPAATRPRSNKLLFAGIVVFAILFMITAGIVSGVIEMQGKANANGAADEQDVALVVEENEADAQETAPGTPAGTAADEGAQQGEHTFRAVTPLPRAHDSTRTEHRAETTEDEVLPPPAEPPSSGDQDAAVYARTSMLTAKHGVRETFHQKLPYLQALSLEIQGDSAYAISQYDVASMHYSEAKALFDEAAAMKTPEEEVETEIQVLAGQLESYFEQEDSRALNSLIRQDLSSFFEDADDVEAQVSPGPIQMTMDRPQVTVDVSIQLTYKNKKDEEKSQLLRYTWTLENRNNQWKIMDVTKLRQ